MAQATHVNRNDVETIAAELGIEFELAKGNNHAITSSDTVDRLDPDIVYLYDPGHKIDTSYSPFFKRPFDAFLKYKDHLYSIRWQNHSKASIRKMLIDGMSECIVCYGGGNGTSDGLLHLSHCPQCCSSICTFCLLKLALRPEAIECPDLWPRLHGPTSTLSLKANCLQCRAELVVRVRDVYVRVMDRLQEFGEMQQKLLLFIKNTDPDFAKKECMEKQRLNERRRSRKETRARMFRKGCRVKLQGLKKKEWNGQKAIIIGGKIVKNDVIRWPIQLLNRSKAKAQLKQCNLRKVKLSKQRK